MDNTIDPTVQALAKAIKKNETGVGDTYATSTGKDGEVGAYRFLPTTWSAWAGKHLKDPNAPLSVENQNKVAYSQIKEWKDGGLTPAQIASKWNSGNENAYKDPTHKGISKGGAAYDTPAYVSKVSADYEAFKPKAQPQAPQEQPQAPQNESGTWFTSKPTDSPLMSGAKAAGNLIPSAYNFAKGIISQVNPINTVKNIAEMPGVIKDIYQQDIPTSQKLGNVVSGTYESAVPQAGRQILSGNLEGAQKSLTEDPFGQVAPFVFAAQGGAKGIDTLRSKAAMADYVKNLSAETATQPIPKPITAATDAFGKTIETIARPVLRPVEAVAGAVGNLAGKVAGGIVSQLTSLNPAEIRAALMDPDMVSKASRENASRGGLASEFSDAIDYFTEAKKDTGAEYGAIRTMQQPVVIPPEFFKEALAEFKLSLDKKGQVKADTTSLTRNPSDLASVQRFLDNWSKKKTLTPEEVLNMRSDVAGDLSKFHMDKTTAATKIGDSLYAKINDTLGKQVPGLRELDVKMAPQIEYFKQLKKDFLNPDGTFKDGAISRIANATGKGKENLLARMEEIAPGITRRIQILKLAEGIEAANGIKVGSYTRGILTGGSILSGNIAGILFAIITAPENAIRILKAAGYTGKAVIPIVRALKAIAGDVPPIALSQGGEKSQYTGLLNQGKTLTNTPQ